jgi:hypothetical protein
MASGLPQIFTLTKEVVETLAWYIIRASFSQERMQYLADEGTVIYSAKDDKDRKVFDAPEWLAVMCSHVPNRGEQMVRYYGYYSNVSRGRRQKEAEDGTVPHIIESDMSSAAVPGRGQIKRRRKDPGTQEGKSRG